MTTSEKTGEAGLSNLVVLMIAFAIGAYNSFAFFASFGLSSVEQFLWGLGGVAVELLKATIWRKTRSRRGLMVTAVLFSIVTLSLSVGQVLLSLERTRAVSQQDAETAAQLEESRLALMTDRQKLSNKITEDTGPNTTKSIAAQVESMIQSAAAIQDKSLATHRAPTALEIISKLTGLIGMNGTGFIIAIFAAIYLAFEIVTVTFVIEDDVFDVLRGWRRPKGKRSTKIFLKAALMENEELHGRREMLELGWRLEETDFHIRELRKRGLVVSQGRGRRLRYVVPSELRKKKGPGKDETPKEVVASS